MTQTLPRCLLWHRRVARRDPVRLAICFEVCAITWGDIELMQSEQSAAHIDFEVCLHDSALTERASAYPCVELSDFQYSTVDSTFMNKMRTSVLTYDCALAIFILLCDKWTNNFTGR
jgi:hypothetical protein